MQNSPASGWTTWGMSIEVDYAPLLPATVTGAHLMTDASGDHEGTITVQTSSGDRSVSIALPGLASKVAEWCGGVVDVHLSTAHADVHGHNVEAAYRVVSPRDVVVAVTTPGWRTEPLTVTSGDEAELTVSSTVGCSANPSRIALTATYADGTVQQLHAPAPGNEVCG